MKLPAQLKYTKDHEWIKILDNNIALIGITDFAQSELGDIVYIDVPTKDKNLQEGDVFGTVEAVKTVSDLFLPVAGKIIDVNTLLDKNPELVNSDPYGDGWMVKIEIYGSINSTELLDADQYQKLIA